MLPARSLCPCCLRTGGCWQTPKVSPRSPLGTNSTEALGSYAPSLKGFRLFVCFFSSVVVFFLCLSVFSPCLQMCLSMVKPDLWSKWEKKINFFLKNFFVIQSYICMGKARVIWQGANAKASFGHPLWARNETPSLGQGVAPRHRGSLLILPFGGKHLNSSDRKLLFGLSVD